MRTHLLFMFLCVMLLLTAGGNVKSGDGGGPFINGNMLGSSGHDEITSMLKLRNGNVVVVGWTDAFEPWVQGGFKPTHSGTADGFIAVLSGDLRNVLSFTFFGGPNADKITGVAEDPDGNLIVIGHTESENLPTTVGAVFPMYSAGVDGFLFAFSSDLKKVIYGTYITGPKDEFPKVVQVDVAGSIYICGSTNSTFGFPTNNGFDKTHNGGVDAFVMKVAPGAAIINFSTYFGSDGTDEFLGMTITKSGAILCTGYTTSGGYQTFPTVNPAQWWQTKDRPYDWTYNGGNSDAVLTVFSEDGARLIVSTYYGGSGADFGRAVVIDERGRIVLIGDSYSTDLPFNSGIQGANKGGSDVFIAQLNENGRTLLGATYIGGDRDDFVTNAAVYNQDLLVIAGTSNSGNFPKYGGGSTNELQGSRNAYLMLAGVSLIEVSTLIGGNGNEEFRACHVDSSKVITLAGFSTSQSVELGRGVVYNNGIRTTSDAFLVQFARGVANLVTPVGGEKFCIGQQTTVSWSVIDMPQEESYTLQVQSSPTAEWITIATGLTSKSYQWRPSASLTPTSEYSMRLLSSRGHESRTPIRFTLYPAVGFNKSPQNMVACPGDSVLMSAEATGGELRYFWKKDGNLISGQTSPSIVIPAAGPENAGRYECTVQSVCGVMAVSNSAYITIGVKPEIVQQPTDVSYVAGGTIKLAVVASGTDVTYLWYKNGVELNGRTSAELTITSAVGNDAGRYHCEVSGRCGKTSSREVSVIMNVTSVSERDANSGFKVSPQPADNILVIESANPFTTLSLYSTHGRIVSTTHQESATNSVMLETATLPSGVYTAVVSNNGVVLLAIPLVVSH